MFRARNIFKPAQEEDKQVHVRQEDDKYANLCVLIFKRSKIRIELYALMWSVKYLS